MAAEVLRRAAALMRERAEAATPVPWLAEPMPTNYRTHEGVVRTYHADFADCANEVAETLDHADADYIASWHPAVALAVADWLDAEFAHQFGPTAEAIDVARAYLGEQS